MLTIFDVTYEEKRISCSVRKKLFEGATTTALTPDLLGISTFLAFWKAGEI